MPVERLPIEPLAQTRAKIYDAFAEFFTGKSAEHLVGDWPEIVRFLHGMEMLAERPSTALHEKLPAPLDVNRCYAKLFLGVGPHTVHLTASAYTNEHRMMCQDDCRALNELYQAFGFVPAPEWASFADSVAVELAFMALMARAQAAPKMQREFLAGRLIPLAASVSHEVGSLDGGPLEDVLRALLGLLEADKALLAQAV